jgi:hypothetical protein
MARDWTEETALATSTGWCNGMTQGRYLIGYLPFGAANFLVGTGKYKFFNVHCWGYILEKV